jgi:hypothetical protein
MDYGSKHALDYFESCKKGPDVSLELTEGLETISRWILGRLSMEASSHNHEFIERMDSMGVVDSDLNSSPSKTNSVAVSRYLRRLLNSVALQLTKEEILQKHNEKPTFEMSRYLFEERADLNAILDACS